MQILPQEPDRDERKTDGCWGPGDRGGKRARPGINVTGDRVENPGRLECRTNVGDRKKRERRGKKERQQRICERYTSQWREYIRDKNWCKGEGWRKRKARIYVGSLNNSGRLGRIFFFFFFSTLIPRVFSGLFIIFFCVCVFFKLCAQALHTWHFGVRSSWNEKLLLLLLLLVLFQPLGDGEKKKWEIGFCVTQKTVGGMEATPLTRSSRFCTSASKQLSL